MITLYRLFSIYKRNATKTVTNAQGLVQGQRYNVVVEGARNHLICAFKPFEFELDFVCKCGRDKTLTYLRVSDITLEKHDKCTSYTCENWITIFLRPIDSGSENRDCSLPIDSNFAWRKFILFHIDYSGN
ncbi:hypothetical protein LXL04_015673 [Taraxacum kok-saghyz]